MIKSTPEGARDFIVPSRINSGEFYALPQSPQTFKQLLMVSGFDKYVQIVRCFRDEDLRADRQPEFTQIDCEMSFVDQEDVLNTFEGLVQSLFKSCIDFSLEKFDRISYKDAMEFYGSDKPDTRFDMKFLNLSEKAKGNDFKIFDSSESIYGFNIENGESFSRKEIDYYTDWVKRPQIGALGLIWIKHNQDGSVKSSIDKFYSADELKSITNSNPGDLTFIISGDKKKTLWFECEYYNTNVCEHIRGGDPIAVSGEFKIRDYNDKTYFKIKASALQLLGNKKREPNRYVEGDNLSEKNDQETKQDMDDEIPF